MKRGAARLLQETLLTAFPPRFAPTFTPRVVAGIENFLMTKAQKEAPLYRPSPQRCTGLFVLQLTPFLPPFRHFSPKEEKALCTKAVTSTSLSLKMSFVSPETATMSSFSA